MNQQFECQGIGRLTKDPLFTKGKREDGKDDRAWFVVASNPPKSSDGSERDPTYIPVVCWGVAARNAAQYLSKGQVVSVRGRLNTRTVKKDDGTFDHYAEVVASNITYGPKAKNSAQPAAAAAPAEAPVIDQSMLAAVAALLAQSQAAPQAQAASENPFA